MRPTKTQGEYGRECGAGQPGIAREPAGCSKTASESDSKALQLQALLERRYRLKKYEKAEGESVFLTGSSFVTRSGAPRRCPLPVADLADPGLAAASGGESSVFMARR
jgi:hypothetical protein